MTCALKIQVKLIILSALFVIIPSLVSCNSDSNDKLAIVDINLGFNKSAETNNCPKLTLIFKSQDNIIDHDKEEII